MENTGYGAGTYLVGGAAGLQTRFVCDQFALLGSTLPLLLRLLFLFLSSPLLLKFLPIQSARLKTHP